MPMQHAQGRYRVRVVSQSFSESKSGKPQFVLRVVPIGRYNFERPGGALDTCHDEERGIYMTITDKSIDYVVDKLAALGFDGRSFSELDPETPNHVSFVGKEIDAVCKHEEYQGKVGEKWDVSLASTAPGATLDSAGVRKLDALYGSKLKRGVGNAKLVKREVAQASANGNVTEDDIPF